MAAKTTSCGVIVTDGVRVLLGHATRSPRWDSPQGAAEAGDSFAAAARRELAEETVLAAPEAALRPLGVHAYLRGKDLALFAWVPPVLPDPAQLRCAAMVVLPNGARFPEFDRFGLFTHGEALQRVGKNLARVLGGISLSALREASA
jgi:predicted NUDIX family NTP pyrophosphohydrolase